MGEGGGDQDGGGGGAGRGPEGTDRGLEGLDRGVRMVVEVGTIRGRGVGWCRGGFFG